MNSPQDVLPPVVLAWLAEAGRTHSWPAVTADVLDAKVTVAGTVKRFAELTRADLKRISAVLS